MWHVFHSSCLCLNALREDCDRHHSSDLSLPPASFQNYRCLWPPIKSLYWCSVTWSLSLGQRARVVNGRGVMGALWGRYLLWVHQRHRSWLARTVPSMTGTECWGSDWPLCLWWNESAVGFSWKERCGHVDMLVFIWMHKVKSIF